MMVLMVEVSLMVVVIVMLIEAVAVVAAAVVDKVVPGDGSGCSCNSWIGTEDVMVMVVVVKVVNFF